MIPADGCPVAVEVFCGNTGDPATVGAQVEKIQRRFGVDNVALVGDRGMITTARSSGRISNLAVLSGYRH